MDILKLLIQKLFSSDRTQEDVVRELKTNGETGNEENHQEENKITFILLPAFGDSKEYKITVWHFKVGDIVQKGNILCEIENKKLYSEMYRVLKTGGHFLFYDILKKGDEEVSYPMPWASTIDLSFLFKVEEMDHLLQDLGMIHQQTTDQTQAGIDFFDTLITRLKEFGPPKMGLNVLMGETTKPKLMNLLSHLKSEKLELKSGVYKKIKAE